MEIQEFISNGRYSSNVKEGGLSYLIENWFEIVTKIPYDKYNNSDIYSYANDLDTRAIIASIEEECKISQDMLAKINEYDSVFKNKTIEVNQCVYGSKKLKKEYNNIRHWFYFRLPPERIPDWYHENSEEMNLWRTWKEKSNCTSCQAP
jgi:hypothetical protein